MEAIKTQTCKQEYASVGKVSVKIYFVLIKKTITANDFKVNAHANILALFLTVFCPQLCVHMYCTRALTSVHRLYSIDLA